MIEIWAALYFCGLIGMFLPRLGFALLMFWALFIPPKARAEHNHAALGTAGEFYSSWNRPKGNFSGIGHRTQSCCNRTDCSAVLETEMRAGKMYARFELDPAAWYRVDQSIIESNQDDPRESPDHRAHGCVIGGAVACYVHGGGT